MSGAVVAVQQSLYSRLAAALSVPVYDVVPQDLDQPFVVIGVDTATPADTKTYNAVQHNVVIDVYSSQRGMKETKEIMDAIYDELHRKPISVSGFTAVTPQFDFWDTFVVPDEGTRGVIRFRFTTVPE